jgi:CRP-like cAMP-binding protein
MNQYIRLVLDGELRVLRDGQATYKLQEGNFVSECGLHAGLLLPGKVESCCSVTCTAPQSHCLCWERNTLMDLLHREKNLRRAIKAALSWDIVRKLKSQRQLLASGTIVDPESWTKKRNEQNDHRYAAILHNMLEHPSYMAKRREELNKYRMIHHIDDRRHEKALQRFGWTLEEFEAGVKEGQEVFEEDLAEHRSLKWILQDIYFRMFG